MTSRPLTPLQAMTKTSLEILNLGKDTQEEIISVDPHLITNWKYKDRIEEDLGDIQSLAQEFKTIGQQQPCVVRPLKNNSPFRYELIAGERRWRASLQAGLELKVLIKTLTDEEAAIIQISENESRQNLSDYAKSMSYSRLLSDNILTQKDLVQKLGKSKQYISSLLSFSKIPQKILASIGDLSKVSYRTAEEICRLSNKGENYIDAILMITDKIKTGKYGVESIRNFVTKKIDKNLTKQKKDKYYNKHGQLLFYMKELKHKNFEITLSKEVSTKISDFKTEFTEEILCVINKLLNQSAGAD